MLKSTEQVYNETRIRNIKRAKLKYLESKLQLQTKQGADQKEIHQTMKDINKLQKELNKK